MKSKCLIVLIALLLGGLSINRADAGALTDLGRFFGWGWSNGYHAYNGCDWYGPACNGSCSPKPMPGYTHPAMQPTPAAAPTAWQYQSRQVPRRPATARPYRAWPTR